MKNDTRKYIKFNDDTWNVINLIANGKRVRKQDALHLLLKLAIKTKSVQTLLKSINVSAAYLKALVNLK